jgi:signal peptidase II
VTCPTIPAPIRPDEHPVRRSARPARSSAGVSSGRRIVVGSAAGGAARTICTATEEPLLAEQPVPGTREPEPPRRRRTRLLLSVAAAVLAVDVVTKVVVVATIAPGESIRILGGFLYLTDLRNVGAAFSFAQGATILFSVIAVAVAAVIVRTARRLRSKAWATALGLVLGGALGNLADRIFRAPGVFRGGVVDFLSLLSPDGHVWPVFNVADSAIVCGGILGALLAVRGIEFDGSRSRGDTSDEKTSDGSRRNSGADSGADSRAGDGSGRS